MSEYCRNTKKHKKTQVTEALPKHGSLQLKLTESAPACRVFFVLGGLRVGPLVTSPGQVTSEARRSVRTMIVTWESAIFRGEHVVWSRNRMALALRSRSASLMETGAWKRRSSRTSCPSAPLDSSVLEI